LESKGKKVTINQIIKKKIKDIQLGVKLKAIMRKMVTIGKKKITNPRTKLEKAKKWEDCENMQIRTALKEIMRKCPIGQENKK